MNRGSVAGALLVVIVIVTMPACVRKSNARLRCARLCQADGDRCLTAATQSAEVQSCKQANDACVDACPP